MRPDHWLWLVFCVPFIALTVIMVYRKDIQAIKIPVIIVPRDSLLEQMEVEDLRGNWVTDQDPPGKTAVKWK